jgi:hypothetical protein
MIGEVREDEPTLAEERRVEAIELGVRDAQAKRCLSRSSHPRR